MIRSQWMSGIGGVIMASAALLWFVNPAGAIQLESWDNKMSNANQRFKVLNEFNGAAVLDKETQLVWEQSPSPNPFSWTNARIQCTSRETGGRKGWRLPSVHELASLVDPNNSNPALPTGHPFTNIDVQPPALYWSASTDADLPTQAWYMFFGNGNVDTLPKSFNDLRAWCVRGGQNHGDTY